MGNRIMGIQTHTPGWRRVFEKLKAYIDSRSISPDAEGFDRTPGGLVPVPAGGRASSRNRRMFEIFLTTTTAGDKIIRVEPGYMLAWNSGSGSSSGVPKPITPTLDGGLMTDPDNGFTPTDGGAQLWFKFDITREDYQENDGNDFEDSNTDTINIHRIRHLTPTADIEHGQSLPNDQISTGSPPIGYTETYLSLGSYLYTASTGEFTVETQKIEGSPTYIIGDVLYDGDNPPT